MLVEEFVINKKGELEFNEHTLCCYFEENGAFVVNGSLLISPKVKKIKCSFNGKMKYCFTNSQKEKQENIIEYSTIIFTNCVVLNSSCLKDHAIKSIYFLQDVIEIKGKSEYLEDKSIYIPFEAKRIYKYLEQNHLDFHFL